MLQNFARRVLVKTGKRWDKEGKVKQIGNTFNGEFINGCLQIEKYLSTSVIARYTFCY